MCVCASLHALYPLKVVAIQEYRCTIHSSQHMVSCLHLGCDALTLLTYTSRVCTHMQLHKALSIADSRRECSRVLGHLEAAFQLILVALVPLALGADLGEQLSALPGAGLAGAPVPPAGARRQGAVGSHRFVSHRNRATPRYAKAALHHARRGLTTSSRFPQKQAAATDAIRSCIKGFSQNSRASRSQGPEGMTYTRSCQTWHFASRRKSHRVEIESPGVFSHNRRRSSTAAAAPTPGCCAGSAPSRP